MLIDATALIHPLSCVTDSAVGARSKVWQFASVIRGAVIGDNCTIASGAMIDGSRIGNRSIVGQNAAISPGFAIGEDVFIGPNVTLCNDAWPRASKDGFGLYIPAIAWGSAEESLPHMAIVIENGVGIGANAVILPGIVIGAGAMIAAGAVVDRDVPTNCLWKRDGSLGDIKPDREKTARERRIRFAAHL